MTEVLASRRRAPSNDMVSQLLSARVEGDIHHMSLAIEQGAEFDGRCRRPADAAELNLNLETGSLKPN